MQHGKPFAAMGNKNMPRYKQVKNGEWVQPVRKGYLMKCCDCGLVHKLNFRVIKYGNNQTKVQFQAFRLPKRGKQK